MDRMELADAIHDAEEQYRRENPIIQEFKLVEFKNWMEANGY